MTNLERLHQSMEGLTRDEKEVFSAVFIGALSAMLLDDVGRGQWGKALETARNYSSIREAVDRLVVKRAVTKP